jgi:hypothetical protein
LSAKLFSGLEDVIAMSTFLIDKAWNWLHVEDIPLFWKGLPPSMDARALATPRALRIAVSGEIRFM